MNVFSKICMPPRGCLPNPCPMGAVDSRVTHSVGVGRAAKAREVSQGKAEAQEKQNDAKTKTTKSKGDGADSPSKILVGRRF